MRARTHRARAAALALTLAGTSACVGPGGRAPGLVESGGIAFDVLAVERDPLATGAWARRLAGVEVRAPGPAGAPGGGLLGAWCQLYDDRDGDRVLDPGEALRGPARVGGGGPAPRLRLPALPLPEDWALMGDRLRLALRADTPGGAVTADWPVNRGPWRRGRRH